MHTPPAAAALIAVLATAPTVHAQTYPAKPVRIIIAQAPGSTTDVVSRLLGQKLQEYTGQGFVIDARPGAGGSIGTEVAAKAPADGYTLIMGNNSTHGANPALYSKLGYDAVRDFAPITLVASTPYVLVVHPSLPVTTVKQLIALAKSRPGQINYASAGNGSTHHLSGELLKTMGGIDMVHIPYKGTTPAITALIGGEATMMFATATGIVPHVKSGKVKALAVTTAKRAPALPDTPTVAEAALPGFEIISWFGLLAPAGTPAPILQRLNTETVKALATPEVRTGLANQGLDVASSTPEVFADYVRSEIAKFTKLAKAANIRMD